MLAYFYRKNPIDYKNINNYYVYTMNPTTMHFRQEEDSLVRDVSETLRPTLGSGLVDGNSDRIRRSIRKALALHEGTNERDPDRIFTEMCALARLWLRAPELQMADAVWNAADPQVVYAEDGTPYPRSKHPRVTKSFSPFDQDEHSPSVDMARYIRDHLDF